MIHVDYFVFMYMFCYIFVLLLSSGPPSPLKMCHIVNLMKWPQGQNVQCAGRCAAFISFAGMHISSN